jgi:DNA transposition AAA+ family ATPase
MVMVSGPTGRSKTWALDEWRHRNNHGRAVYCYAPKGGHRKFLVALGKSLGVAASNTNDKLEASISHALDDRNVLVIDEIAHLYPDGRAANIRSLEFIRELHDTTGCGIVLCCTDGLPEMIKAGKWGQWFDQLLGRIELHLRIPREFSRREIAELLAAYTDDPPPELVSAARAIVQKSDRGCRELFRHLDRAAQVAGEIGQPLSAEILQRTVAAADVLLTFPKD